MSCKHKTEVYSRVVGYYRPVQQWNKGKQAEYADRVPFKLTGGTPRALTPHPSPTPRRGEPDSPSPLVGEGRPLGAGVRDDTWSVT